VAPRPSSQTRLARAQVVPGELAVGCRAIAAEYQSGSAAVTPTFPDGHQFDVRDPGGHLWTIGTFQPRVPVSGRARDCEIRPWRGDQMTAPPAYSVVAPIVLLGAILAPGRRRSKSARRAPSVVCRRRIATSGLAVAGLCSPLQDPAELRGASSRHFSGIFRPGSLGVGGSIPPSSTTIPEARRTLVASGFFVSTDAASRGAV